MLQKLKDVRNKVEEAWNDEETLRKINHTIDLVQMTALHTVAKTITIVVVSAAAESVAKASGEAFRNIKSKLKSENNEN